MTCLLYSNRYIDLTEEQTKVENCVSLPLALSVLIFGAQLILTTQI